MAENKAVSLNTSVPLWSVLIAIASISGGWYLMQDGIDRNETSIVRFSKVIENLNVTVNTLNTTLVRMEEREKAGSKILEETHITSIENKDKLFEHEGRIKALERVSK